MELREGSVVVSKAGRDKGSFLLVIEASSRGVFVCDGGERPLERPKRKNPRHLAVTGYTLDRQAAATNRSLRRALRELCARNESEV